MKQAWFALLLLGATTALWSQAPSLVIETKASDLDAILQSMERVQQQNPAQSRPYDVTRQYKVFRADDKRPISEVTARISFTPPDSKTYKITHASGNPREKRQCEQF
jgi:hypothetical protein